MSGRLTVRAGCDVVLAVEDRTVPLQNRVLPTGEIIADPARGLMMGNRGCLHGQGCELGVSRWRSKAWICCVLDWKDVRRDPMPPGRWTALFFLDEATALAAGHRPCGYCRRSDFLRFATAWRAAQRLTRTPRAGELDAVLHGERVDRTRRQVTRIMDAGQLPDGVMIRTGNDAGLLIGGRLTGVVADRLRCRGRGVRPRRGADAAGDRRRDRGRRPANGSPDRVA